MQNAEGQCLAVRVHHLSAWDMIILCAPQKMRRKPHPSITEMVLIRKDSLLDPIEDDNDIEWPYNPYEVKASTNHLSPLQSYWH